MNIDGVMPKIKHSESHGLANPILPPCGAGKVFPIGGEQKRLGELLIGSRCSSPAANE